MREIKYKAIMQRYDGVMYVSQPYSIDNNLSYLFDFENNRWDKFLEMITTEGRFVELFPDDDDEHLKGWTHIQNIQYTGEKDKNDIEIYEGDYMLDSHSGCCGEVKFYRGAFVVEFDNEIQDLCDWACECVVGNIYENQELRGIK